MRLPVRLAPFAWPLLLITLAACDSHAQDLPSGIDNGLAYFPVDSWRTATPAQVQVSASGLATVLQNVAGGRYGSVQGVLVVRYGYLVAEQYNGWDRATPHTMQSVTKSITSLLFGILQHDNPATRLDLERPVLDLFTRYPSIDNIDARKQSLTLRHLLTMRTSMDFWEQPYPGSPLDQLNRSTGDWVKFVLDRPMKGAPGSTWAYNSGAAIAMGGVLREVSGLNPVDFARQRLFAPIGVSGEYWFQSPFDGLPHMGGGLYLKPIDLARVGYLVLRRGLWNSREVVPSAWIDSSTHLVSRGSEVFFSNFNSGYGMFWWLFPAQRGGSDTGVIAASGSGGQWLFIVPQLDLVIAVVAENGDGLDMLYDILAAVGHR